MKKYGNPIANNAPEWQLFEKLYEDNYLNWTDPKIDVIPKKIHQIWLGSPLPDKFKAYTETWKQFHPTWEYKLWTDADVADLHIKKKREYNYAKNYGMKSDILRYEILAKHGGLYVDTDFECLKPFDPFMYLHFFVGSTHTTEPCFYNSLIACTPHHPIIEQIRSDVRLMYDGHKSKIIMGGTGPYHFTKSFLASIKRNEYKVAVFPVNYFYPLKHTTKEIEDKSTYVTEESYAIHYWAISWIKANQDAIKL